MTVFLIFFSFFVCMLGGWAEISYKVEYLGIENPSILKEVKASSHLTTLRNTLPESIQALSYRAESDIPEILKVLHSYGYYEASVQVKMQTSSHSKAVVILEIYLGPIYTVGSFNIALSSPVSCAGLSASSLKIEEGMPIIARQVNNAEFFALEKLALCGYPFAAITKRDFIADGDTKTVSLHLEIDTGPLSHFGEVTVKGNKEVKNLYLEQKLTWKQGDAYSSESVEQTQKELMDSGLFSSVSISHGDIPSPDGMLPMTIDVAETKHKSIYGGVSYQTYYGPGVTAGWEHRNVHQMGEKFSIRGDLTKRSHSGTATYLIPNFHGIGQDYVWEGQATYVNLLPYAAKSYNLTNRFEKSFSKKSRVAFGLKGERLFVHASAQNGVYTLVEVPIFFAYNDSNNLLNPTTGFNAEYQATPSISVSSYKRAYVINQFAFAYYIPLIPSHYFVLAQQVSGGYFFSGDVDTIPLSKRFFGGSEDELRGYTYYSVSPLNHKDKLIGGRSAIYYTLETRIRFTKEFGIVPFFDMGNVSDEKFLTFQGKWLKSAGLGIRYYSFIGPFRVDIGFPLNPRKGIDKKCRVLVSIGQTF